MLEFIHGKHKKGENNWDYINRLFEFYGEEKFDWFHDYTYEALIKKDNMVDSL